MTQTDLAQRVRKWSPKLVIIYVIYRIVKYAMSKVSVGNLNQKAVLITGCDSGFGQLTSQRLARKGLKVFSGCLTEEGVKNLTHVINVTPFLLDVTNEESVAAGFALVQQKAPQGLWAVINNAGVFRSGALEIMPISHWRLQLDVNVLGIAIVTKTFFPLLLKAKGRIVNIASVAGRTATPVTSGYNASKYAVEGLSDSWRREMKVWGIKVIIVEPGVMKTPLWDTSTQEVQVDAVWDTLTEEQRTRFGRKFFEEVEIRSKSLLNSLGGNPQSVVDVLDRAVTSKWPSTRYSVGKDSVIWLALSRLPTCVADLVLNLLMNSPTPAILQKRK